MDGVVKNVRVFHVSYMRSINYDDYLIIMIINILDHNLYHIRCQLVHMPEESSILHCRYATLI
jgi:hypothetical protein